MKIQKEHLEKCVSNLKSATEDNPIAKHGFGATGSYQNSQSDEYQIIVPEGSNPQQDNFDQSINKIEKKIVIDKAVEIEPVQSSQSRDGLSNFDVIKVLDERFHEEGKQLLEQLCTYDHFKYDKNGLVIINNKPILGIFKLLNLDKY